MIGEENELGFWIADFRKPAAGILVAGKMRLPPIQLRSGQAGILRQARDKFIKADPSR